MPTLRFARFGRLAIIVPSAFLNSLGIGLVNLGLLFIVKEVYKAEPSVVGIFGAVWAIAYFASCLMLRKWTARLVPRVSMTVMLLSSAALFSLYSLHPGLAASFAAYAAFGLITAFFWPPLMGWLSRGIEGEELSAAQGAFSFSWSLGGVISPYLAGLLSERGKFLPVHVSVCIFLVAGIFVSLSRIFYKDALERPESATMAGSASPGEAGGVDRSTKLRFPAWTGVFAAYAVMGVVFNIFPVFARDGLGLSESVTGAILSLRAVFTVFGFLILGRVSGWHFRHALMPAVAMAFSVLVAILAFTPGAAAYAVAFPVIGVLLAFSYSGSMFYGASGALDRDARMTVHETLLTAGQIVGSVAGGLLYQAFTMRIVFLFLAGCLAAAAAVQLAMISRNAS
ncbi:MAG: MFS transporter [Spirochaetes bacterium]|nr:MFS transporter [Spirochaetota bacterium]